MRIFLDSKDLISLFRKSNPMSVKEAQAWFRSQGATLVLAQSSVCEFVPVDETDKLRIRAELQELENFPLAYIRLGDIQRHELHAAAASFGAAAETAVAIDPYVSQFWRTFWKLESKNLHDVLIKQEIERRINFRLHDQVLMLWIDPINFQNESRLTARVQKILDAIRSDTKTPRAKFHAELPAALAASDCALPEIANFAEWLRSRPAAAPGWRLHYEVLQEWATNTTDNAKDGDLHDVTHLFGVPYLDYATLDRRFVDYASRAAKRLRQIDPAIDYDARVCRTFGEIVKRLL